MGPCVPHSKVEQPRHRVRKHSCTSRPPTHSCPVSHPDAAIPSSPRTITLLVRLSRLLGGWLLLSPCVPLRAQVRSIIDGLRAVLLPCAPPCSSFPCPKTPPPTRQMPRPSQPSSSCHAHVPRPRACFPGPPSGNPASRVQCTMTTAATATLGSSRRLTRPRLEPRPGMLALPATVPRRAHVVDARSRCCQWVGVVCWGWTNRGPAATERLAESGSVHPSKAM
jgi:hypothetical protein